MSRQWNYGCMFPGSSCHTWTVTNGNILYLIFLLLVGIDVTHSLVVLFCLRCRLMNYLYRLHNKFGNILPHFTSIANFVPASFVLLLFQIQSRQTFPLICLGIFAADDYAGMRHSCQGSKLLGFHSYKEFILPLGNGVC